MASGLRELALSLGLVAACASAIAFTQPSLAENEKKAKEAVDIYLLPPDDQLVLMSLGYRAALADLLWSEVLINQGIRLSEKRGFENSGPLVRAVVTLDPSFREPYRLADSMITFQSVKADAASARITRDIMEQGVAVFPNDGELWLNLGQFVAYLGPDSILTDEDEKKEWKETGARYMARAAELGSDPRFANLTVSGAGLFGKAGKRDAQIRFYERLLSTTEDDALRDEVTGYLRLLLGEEQFEAHQARERAFQDVWRQGLPATSKTMAFLMGYPRDPAACAGVGQKHDGEACARTWKDWGAAFEAKKQAR